MRHTGENVVRIEADALRPLADRIAGPMANAFNRAVELMDACRGRVVVTGMGKSGIIARKIAATLSSIGTPALFMHPVDAIHGDLGMVVRGDVVLAESADIALDCSVDKEACSLGLAPTASTTTMLALGDALAVALSEKKGFKEEDFANLHPGGKLGKKLARVESLMHAGEAIPRVAPTTRMSDVIYEMPRKKLGMTTVVENEKLLGVVSDGDLRRLLEHRGKDVLDLTAADCMTRDPKTISAHEFAATALALMEEKKITSLVAIDEHQNVKGV